ncbi:MAG: ABC transporter permease [Planctomycetes bacterium]|nr:ABC transporter permease [Planctomycetota bacterium]
MTIDGIRESWRYRELVYFFAWRDIKVRYKQAALGAIWAVLQPLLGMIVFTIFFGRLAKVPSDGIPYPLFAYVGLALWTYFSSVLSQGGQSLTANTNLVTKVYFPRFALPASSALSGLLDLSVSLGFVSLLMAYYRIHPGWSFALAPVFLMGLVLFTVGMSLLLAAINVWYRDVKYTLPLLIQLGLFISPVIYPTSFLPERFRPLMYLNPMAGMIEGFRNCMVMGRWPDPTLSAVSLSFATIVFLLGWVYFRRAERAFADVI